MKTVKGDLIMLAKQGMFDVIIHGCDCYGDMGGGIAKSIREHFPEAYAADQNTEKGNVDKLGSYSSAVVASKDHTLTIVNAYTQPHWKGHGVLVDYNAVAAVMKLIKVDFSGRRIAYPRIGAGLARGDWTILSHIIEDALNIEDHTLVDFEKNNGNEEQNVR